MAKNRSLNKIGKDFDKIVTDMKKMAAEYAKADGTKKQSLLNKLKQMTKEKKRLQGEMESAVNASDKDVELQVDEVSQLIRSEVNKIIKEYDGNVVKLRTALKAPKDSKVYEIAKDMYDTLAETMSEEELLEKVVFYRDKNKKLRRFDTDKSKG